VGDEDRTPGGGNAIDEDIEIPARLGDAHLVLVGRVSETMATRCCDYRRSQMRSRMSARRLRRGKRQLIDAGTPFCPGLIGCFRSIGGNPDWAAMKTA
jgi:hypothetical protein